MTKVSCVVPAGMIQVCRERGLAVDAAFADFPLSLDVLEDGSGRIEWAHFAAATEILDDLAGGPPDGVAGLARDLHMPRALGSVGRLFRFAVGPRQLYQIAVRFMGPRAFPTHRSSFEILPGNRYRIELELDASLPGCAAYFHGCRGFWEIAPRTLGLEDALVEAEIDSHHGRYLVTPPPAPSLLSRVRRVFELYRNSDAVIQELQERHASLAEQARALGQARRELRESERRFADAFHASPMPMVIAPLTGDRLLDANDSFLEAIQMSHNDLLLTPIDSLPFWAPGTDPREVREHLRAQSPFRSADVRFRDPQGEIRHGLLSSSVSEFAGQTVALIQVADVTDHDDLEARRHQSQKMEVVGQMAGGVAHDFNNLLTVIGGYADQQLASLDPGSSDHEAAQEILRAAERASKLTGQLLAFARRQILHPQRIDLNGTVRDMLSMLERLIDENVALRSELDPELAMIVADPGRIEQVLLNLAVNGRDAMPSGGELSISTRPAAPEEAREAEGAEPLPGPYVALCVSDTGTGMHPDVHARIFEPFFTTKPAGEGTGLGLSTVQGIVVQSGGRIRVETKPGAGTTVSVFLPAAVGDEEQLQRTPAPTKGEVGGETILLAEDEARVRGLMCRQLESAGYRVLAAGSGAEALELEGGHEGPIHALVSDVVMPGMGGVELAERLLRRRPDVRTLFVSGYPLDQSISGEAQLLGKPFLGPELTATVRSMLTSAARAEYARG